MHKSLAITLQFTGRFTRTSSNIGDATMIANIGLGQIDETLQDLYAEDADWNFLLRRMSEGETGRQARKSEFLDGFTDPPTEIPLQNIFPKMSAVVYRTRCINWRPKGVLEAIKESRLYVKPAVNQTTGYKKRLARSYGEKVAEAIADWVAVLGGAAGRRRNSDSSDRTRRVSAPIRAGREGWFQ
ncbi:MAG: hypothetical protein MOB07_30440 [Acidobacteria bacterium]|nr:hypothetical protein [Acidobacteriota bacterium]